MLGPMPLTRSVLLRVLLKAKAASEVLPTLLSVTSLTPVPLMVTFLPPKLIADDCTRL